MKSFDAIIDDPNICTHHAHIHSRATLLPDSDIILSIEPLSQSCLSSHVQSDRSRDDEGEVACWKADVSMSGM